MQLIACCATVSTPLDFCVCKQAPHLKHPQTACHVHVQELETAHTINSAKKQELLEAQAKCGELTSELQQKTATIEACKVRLRWTDWCVSGDSSSLVIPNVVDSARHD